MENYSSPATLIRAICLDNVTTLPRERVFVGIMPESQDLTVSFNDYGGGEQSARVAYDTYKIQIQSRGQYQEAWSILNEYRLLLQSTPQYTASNGDVVTGIWVKTSIAFIGRDEQERSMFTMNLKVIITPSNQGHRSFGIDTSSDRSINVGDTGAQSIRDRISELEAELEILEQDQNNDVETINTDW